MINNKTKNEPFTMFGWKAHFQQNHPTDVIGLCKKLNVVCKGMRMDDSVSGYIERVDGADYRIVYNSRHPKVRQRFTIAHELGHYYLHRDILGKGTGDNRAYRSEVEGHENPLITDEHETEANAFAADLLMPKNLIKEWIEHSLSFDEIQERLKVSKAALTFRLKNLRLSCEK